eukprot:CAMPEP_0113934256 /NCGR_PEP_ID=MMETSP1339-20121228/1610_1 /TAXON_ID=94617 /ORGANISM="Fibrocapsa japonica" /LENGTH=124 /DNA_ID=CAMNT_0000935983 /DNA_START=111 /DNA_END=485 /DNA_ORIENTATION=+ /assembly_acc=CAM_ASM_000762
MGIASAFVPALRQPTGGCTVAARSSSLQLHAKEVQLLYNEDDDTEGFARGDRVRVVDEVKFFHPKGYAKEGLDAEGLEGTVENVFLRAKTGEMLTINRPVIVSFTEPVKFTAHFDFDEVEKIEA